MEILIEILMFVVQIVFELILQIIFEGLVELGIHGVRETFRQPKQMNPWLAGLGYAILGAISGGVSLWLLPALFIDNPVMRMANLVVTPLAAGALMGALGAWRRRRNKQLIRLDSFSYGALFAFAMALVRFIWGQ